MNKCPAKRYSSAALSGRWPKIPARTIRDILQKAAVDSKGGYDLNEASDAIIEHFVTRLDTYDVEAARDRGRKAKAEADNVELDNAAKSGEFLRMVKRAANEIGVEFRKEIMGADFISLENRKKVLKLLASK